MGRKQLAGCDSARSRIALHIDSATPRAAANRRKKLRTARGCVWVCMHVGMGVWVCVHKAMVYVHVGMGVCVCEPIAPHRAQLQIDPL